MESHSFVLEILLRKLLLAILLPLFPVPKVVLLSKIPLFVVQENFVLPVFFLVPGFFEGEIKS